MIKKDDLLAMEPVESFEPFPKLALKLLKQAGDLDGEMPESKKLFNLKPDLFSVDFKAVEIRLHEIEYIHACENLKLQNIIEAFNYCDAEGVSLRLFIYDRYGLNKRELDLSILSTIIGPASLGYNDNQHHLT